MLEFAKLHASRAFMPLRLRCLWALLTYLTDAPCTSFSRALRTLFVHVKIVLGWIFSPSKTYHFPRIIKGTTNCAVFKWVKKPAGKLFKRENFLGIFKT